MRAYFEVIVAAFGSRGGSVWLKEAKRLDEREAIQAKGVALICGMIDIGFESRGLWRWFSEWSRAEESQFCDWLRKVIGTEDSTTGGGCGYGWWSCRTSWMWIGTGGSEESVVGDAWDCDDFGSIM